MLHILTYDPSRHYDKRAIRILDFYAVFPQLITEIKLPKNAVAWRKNFSDLHNPYWFTGDPSLVFRRMEPLQLTALDLLYAQGLIEPEAYDLGQVRLARSALERVTLPPEGTLSSKTLEFIVKVLGQMPLHGVGGLKERTHLMEYRYDA